MHTPTTGSLFPTPPDIDAVRAYLPSIYRTADWGTQAWSRDMDKAVTTATAWIDRTATARGWSDEWRTLAATLVESAKRGASPTVAETWLTRARYWFTGFGIVSLWRETVVGDPIQQAEEFFGDLARYWFVAATLADEDAPPGWADMGKVWAQARESTRLVNRGQHMSDLGVMAYEAARKTTIDVQDKGLPVLAGVTITLGAALLGRELAR